MKNWRDKYEHHLLLKWRAMAWAKPNRGWWIISNSRRRFLCLYAGGRQQSVFTPFAAAGAAIRYQAVHSDEVEEFWRWISLCGVTTPSGMSIYPGDRQPAGAQALLRPFYVLCFHQDYIVKKGVDVHALKEQIWNCYSSAARSTLPSITSVIL